MTERFFRKAVACRNKLPKPKVSIPIRSLKGEIAVTKTTRPMQKTILKFMSQIEAFRQVGRSNGATTIQSRGQAHKWTSETARKAAIKSWKHKGRKGPYTGRRIGRKINRRPRTDRTALRLLYTNRWVKGIGYWTQEHTNFPGWYRFKNPAPYRRIGERAALIALGHLLSPRGYVPEEILLIRNGRRLAKVKSGGKS